MLSVTLNGGRGKEQLEYSQPNSILSLNPTHWEARLLDNLTEAQMAVEYISLPCKDHLVS